MSEMSRLNARKSLRIRFDPERSAPTPFSIWSVGGETHRSHNVSCSLARTDRTTDDLFHLSQDGVRIDVFKETITKQHMVRQKDLDEPIANETPENASKATFYTLP